MKQKFIICLLLFGLCYAVEDNEGSESQDSSKSTASNINFRFFDKNKRGATKITNTDSPTFNYLTTSNTVSSSSSGSSSSSNSGFKPIATPSSQTPFRYLYNQQFYQPNPYFTYLQLPQAAQIATQYSLQSNPIAHYLQTPTQIQYVATPTVAQIPQVKYQSYTNEYSGNAVASDSSSSTAASTQYETKAQQVTESPQSYVPAVSSADSSSALGFAQGKQVQVPFYSGYQAQAQPIFYTQQPLIYFQQPRPTNFIYQQPNANFILKQQQQQLAGVLGGNRFNYYTPTQNTQLTYLVPMVVSQPQQDTTTTTSNLKPSDKTHSSVQQSTSSSSFSYGAKA